MKNIIQQLNYAERFGVLQDLKKQSKSYRSFIKKIIFLKILLLLAIIFVNIYFMEHLDFMLQLAVMGLIFTLVDYLINRLFIAPRANLELNMIIRKEKNKIYKKGVNL